MLPRRTVRFPAVATLLVLLVPGAAIPGSFSVSPLRVQLDASHPTSTFHVHNDSDEKIVVQIEAAEWRQAADGTDVYEPSTELVLFPKIVEIDKGAEKNVRLGMAATSTSDKERALRVYFDELPVSKPGETAVRLALRLGIPVFVVPSILRTASNIDTVAILGGTLGARVRNDGNGHLMVRKLVAVGEDGAGAAVFRHEQAGWYVLAGAARTFRLSIPRDECERATAIRVEVEIEDSRPTRTLKANLELSRSRCEPDSARTSGPVH
jgi:fimbrial chaperone protein